MSSSDSKSIVITDESTNLKLLLTEQGDFTSYVKKNGLPNVALIKWCEQYVKDKCFIDIGAHIGSYSLLLGPSSVRTYAFEPHRQSYHLLAGNIALNGLVSKIYAYNSALGDSDGRREIYVPNIDGVKATMKPIESCAVERTTIYKLDDLKLINIGLIKIDTNGTELAVLRGAVNTLKENKSHILLHCDPEDHKEIALFLTENNYGINGVGGCPNYYICGPVKSND